MWPNPGKSSDYQPPPPPLPPSSAILLLQLFTISNTKDALSCIQATAALRGQINCKRVSEHKFADYAARAAGTRFIFEGGHFATETSFTLTFRLRVEI